MHQKIRTQGLSATAGSHRCWGPGARVLKALRVILQLGYNTRLRDYTPSTKKNGRRKRTGKTFETHKIQKKETQRQQDCHIQTKSSIFRHLNASWRPSLGITTVLGSEILHSISVASSSFQRQRCFCLFWACLSVAQRSLGGIEVGNDTHLVFGFIFCWHGASERLGLEIMKLVFSFGIAQRTLLEMGWT